MAVAVCKGVANGKIADAARATPGVVLTNVPTIRGRAAAHRWLKDVLGVPVTFNYVRDAANHRQIPCTKMSGALFFSTQGLFDWIMARYDAAAS
jgi:hypothetical protein